MGRGKRRPSFQRGKGEVQSHPRLQGGETAVLHARHLHGRHLLQLLRRQHGRLRQNVRRGGSPLDRGRSEFRLPRLAEGRSQVHHPRTLLHRQRVPGGDPQGPPRSRQVPGHRHPQPGRIRTLHLPRGGVREAPLLHELHRALYQQEPRRGRRPLGQLGALRLRGPGLLLRHLPQKVREIRRRFRRTDEEGVAAGAGHGPQILQAGGAVPQSGTRQTHAHRQRGGDRGHGRGKIPGLHPRRAGGQHELHLAAERLRQGDPPHRLRREIPLDRSLGPLRLLELLHPLRLQQILQSAHLRQGAGRAAGGEQGLRAQSAETPGLPPRASGLRLGHAARIHGHRTAGIHVQRLGRCHGLRLPQGLRRPVLEGLRRRVGHRREV